MSTVINEDETFQDNFNEMIETGSLVSFNQDQNDDNQSIPDTNDSVNDETKKRRIVREKVKRDDKGYVVYFFNKKNIKIKIESYITDCNIGTLIRCPFTGIRCGDRVGSAKENLYFKVKMPCITKGDINGSLFYTTPDSFERHHFCKVPQEIKNKWYEKNGYPNRSNEEENGSIEIK